MARKLKLEIASHSKRQIKVLPSYISKYELGRGEPDLLMMLAYSRLANVKIDSIVDDEVSVTAFRRRLGKELGTETKKRWL